MSLVRFRKKFSFSEVIEGIKEFSKEYNGELVTETMLVEGVNDDEKNLQRTAEFIKSLGVSRAYITLPLRPPRISSVKPPSKEKIQIAYMFFSLHNIPVVLLDFPEKGEFSTGKDFKNGFLSILSVHPMREEDVFKLLEENGISIDIIKELETNGKIERVKYMGVNFYRKK